jgi:hypothetical protein
MRTRTLILSAALAATLLVPAAAALGVQRFVTPSGNIGCAGDRTDLRCDILETSASQPPKPRSCRFDWGQAFGLTPQGRGRRLCVSDTVVPTRGARGVRTLAYGTTIRLGERMRCTSRRSGLTCRNTADHGFFLSRQRIRVF